MSRTFQSLLLGLFLVPFLPAPLYAIEADDYPMLERFIQDLTERHGFDAGELSRLFEQVEIKQEIMEAVRQPREALPWHEYRKVFVTEYSARRGERYWRKHARALSRAGEIYGVDPAIIVAILGIETQYGRNTGRHRVIDAVTTLMLEYTRRSDFFRKQLEEYLLLTRETAMDPLDIKGSYAGAMGIPQFIPSSYRRYAVDFNNDSKRDIFTDNEDAIGSVAKFFQSHGWKADEPVVDEVEFKRTQITWLEKLGSNTRYSIRHFLNHGVFPPRGADGDLMAALITLESGNGRIYKLAYENFYVITRYNRSKNYAMAVVELSRMIRKRME